MTKIKSFDHLQQILDDELAWRKKELAIIKSLVTAKSTSSEIISCHIRSGIALIYAHWEGFIKEAGKAYLTYIASQRLSYVELASNFVAIATKKHLHDAHESNKIALYTKIVDLFTTGLLDRCNLSTEIETKSNLNSDVLKEIVYMLGLDYTEYAALANLIDETLLKNRNEVAHGRYLRIDTQEFIDLHEKIVELLDLFSNQISNAASTKAYQRSSIISNY